MKIIVYHFGFLTLLCIGIWFTFSQVQTTTNKETWTTQKVQQEAKNYNFRQVLSPPHYPNFDFANFSPKCRNNLHKRDFTKEPIILVANPQNIDQRYLDGVNLQDDTVHIQSCDINCYFTRKWSKIIQFSADAFISYFHPEKIEPVCPYQQNVLYVMENWNAKHLNFNITISPDPDSEIYSNYFWFGGMNLFKKAKPKTRSAIASAFISNCDFKVSSDRIRLIKELRSFGVTIDVFGKCDSNIMEPFELQHLSKSKRKMKNMQFYKFNLCFENSVNDGYVSEKYWQSLVSGSIPVYLGAPDIKLYEPKPNSILNVADFASVKDLAEKIIYLSNNEAAYNQMLEWKTLGASQKFLNVIDYMTTDIWCKLCHRVADSYLEKANLGEILVRERNTWRYRKVVLKKYALTELQEAIYIIFDGYIPMHAIMRNGYSGKLNISRIYYSGLNYKQHLWGDAIDSDEKVQLLRSGAKLEVIF